MAKMLYLISTTPQSGHSLISRCLARLFQHYFPKVTVYQPIQHSSYESTSKQNDEHDDLSQHTHIVQNSTLSYENAQSYLTAGHQSNLIKHMIKDYQNLEDQYDLIISESFYLQDYPQFLNFELNIEVAHTLRAHSIVLINAHQKTLQAIEMEIQYILQATQRKKIDFLGILINRIPEKECSALAKNLKSVQNQVAFIEMIPEHDKLSKPYIYDIVKQLDAEVLLGSDQLNRWVQQPMIAAKHISSFLIANQTQPNTLIIVPADRIDVLMGAILAAQSNHYPSIAGIVLTSSTTLPPLIQKILEGLETLPFPVISTQKNTFNTASILSNTSSNLCTLHPDRINTAIEHIHQNIHIKDWMTHLKKPYTQILTPYMLQHQLEQKAQRNLKHIVLAEGEDLRVLKAAERLLNRNCVQLSLIGNPESIHKLIQTHALSIDPHLLNIIDPNDPIRQERYAKHYTKIRQKKGMNLDIAKDLMNHIPYFATTLLALDECDGVVCGAQHATGDTIRPALQIISKQPHIKRIASLFIMCLKERVVIYADCAINPDPDAETLAEIAINAALMATTLGLKPKIAMLSYASGESSQGIAVDKVRAATHYVAQMHPEFELAGPIQYDAAVDSSISSKKMPTSTLKGEANVLIFPNLDTGNNTYKAVSRESGALAIGPILLGLEKPVNDLSRGCEIDDIVNTVLITALQSAERT